MTWSKASTVARRGLVATMLAMVVAVGTGTAGSPAQTSGRAPHDVHPAAAARSTSTFVGAADSEDAYHGVSQKALEACLHAGKNCLATVPGLANCVRSRVDCNRGAQETLRAQRLHDVQNAGAPITESEAENVARSLSLDPQSANVVQIVSKPYADLPTAGSEGFSSRERAEDLVYVVSMAGKVMTDGSPMGADTVVDTYGVVIDAASHRVVETCLGAFC